MRECSPVCARVRALYTRTGRVCVSVEVWWLLGCLPQLSGALPARTLNPARLNLGIIRGYNQPSSPSLLSPPILLAALPSPPPPPLPPTPPPPSLPCVSVSLLALMSSERVSLSLSLFHLLAFFPFSSALGHLSLAFPRPLLLPSSSWQPPLTPFPAIFRRPASRKGVPRVAPPASRANILQGPSYPPA